MKVEPSFFMNITTATDHNSRELGLSSLDIHDVMNTTIDKRIIDRINISLLTGIARDLSVLSSLNKNLNSDSILGFNVYSKFRITIDPSTLSLSSFDSVFPNQTSEPKINVIENADQNFLTTSSRKMTLTNYNGRNFYIIDTPMSPLEFGEKVIKNNTHQLFNHSNLCGIINPWYASLMLLNSIPTQDNYENLKIWSNITPVEGYDNKIRSENLEVVKEGLYNFLNLGLPAVVKVSREVPNKRHYVTVVGYAEDVKKASDLISSNILVIDSANGKTATLDQSGNIGRDFYAEKNNIGVFEYEVRGPTLEFLEEISKRVEMKNEKAQK